MSLVAGVVIAIALLCSACCYCCKCCCFSYRKNLGMPVTTVMAGPSETTGN
jgi:hypothetical protein